MLSSAGNRLAIVSETLTEHGRAVVIELSERRPIAARGWRLSRTAAVWLARRGVSANAISLAGMGFGLAAGLALALTGSSPRWAWLFWLLGAVLIQARLAANMLDGMVALASGTASRLGELYNEVPDRVSDSAVLIGLGYAAGGDPVLGIAAALAAMLTAYVRAVGRGVGLPQEFCGPMAKQQRMFLVFLVACWGAVADPAQTALTSRLGIGLVTLGELLVLVGSLATAVRRLGRIAAGLQAKP
jgi:phosphatidylglycerophosphate synthase